MSGTSFFGELKRRHVYRVAIVYVIAAWVLLQLASIVFPMFGAPDWVLKIFLTLLVLGFPIALILAWAFEVTPEGVRRTIPVQSPQARAEEPQRRVGRTLDRAIIVVLILALVVMAWHRWGPGKTAHQPSKTTAKVTSSAKSAPPKSIAVLPFENLSPDKDNKYFADGMQDLILTKLADIGDLKVISRTSTMQYGSRPQNLKAIARELGVVMLLEGSVQKAGDQVLINVQLIDAGTDHHIWAQSYQRTLQNIFGVEGEVAEKIAASLKAKIDPAEQKRMAAIPTHNPAAYDAYLRGVSIESNTSDIGTRNLDKAAGFYAKAVQLDPGFALAWAQLASASINAGANEGDRVLVAKAQKALAQAVKLAPDAPETLIAKGNYAYYGQFDFPAALTAFNQALRVAPNSATALVNIGFVKRRQGHFREAVDYMNRSLALDPHNVVTLSNLGNSYFGLGEQAKAREMFRRALAINPNDVVVATLLANTYQAEGDLEKSAAILAGVDVSPIYWQQSYPTVVQQAFLERDYKEAIHLLQKAVSTPSLSDPVRARYLSLLGFAQDLVGETQAAREANRESARLLESYLAAGKLTPIVGAFTTINLALAQAGLGEKQAALASSNKAHQMLPISRDAFSGPGFEAYMAMVQVEVGDKSGAIKTLRQLLAMPRGSNLPYILTPTLLRIDPNWDPLREETAFKALLKDYPVSNSSTSADGPQSD